MAAGVAAASVVASAEETVAMTATGSWDNVVSFSINPTEDHIVMTMIDGAGAERAYETNKRNGQWEELKAISALNDKCGVGEDVGGIFMTDNEQRIYFHANYAGGEGGYDIYYSELTADGWGEPQLDKKISSTGDDTYPTLTNGLETIYLLRHQAVSDVKKEKKESDKQSIYYSDRNAKGEWARALPANVALNYGYVMDVNIALDGKTMYYSIREDKKDESRIIYSYTMLKNEWTLPVKVFNDDSGYDYYSPRYAGGKVYVIKSNNKKRIRAGKIMSFDCPEANRPKATVNELGEVIKKGAKTPVAADIVVYDPTTMNVIGRYESSGFSGIYDLTNRSKSRYIVDVRSKGYSYASYQIDYNESEKPQMPRAIVLFDTIQLVMSVYDAEVFRPLDGKVIAVRQSDKAIIRSAKRSDGKYVMSLPLGSNYNIIATANGFEENKFMFKLEGDIVFSEFERELALVPQKTDMVVSVVDAETKAPLSAEVELRNLKREETIRIKPSEMVGGEAKVKLRTGDKYDMTVSGVKSYSFHNRKVEVKTKDAMKEVVELIALRANSAVRLNNINFETASAEIMPESYEELDRLVELMEQNPGLRFEVSAHTDNVGAASYNMTLSNRRAQSVADYLVESGIGADRLVTKGYGMSKPIVPNDSEENRAQNRRVEFQMIGEE